MKLRFIIFSHFLQSVSAALMIAAGAFWLLLAVAIEHFDNDTAEIGCTISAHDDTDNTPLTKCVPVRSVKTQSASSSRRLESVIPAPFVLLFVLRINCGADIPAKITPVAQFAENPANYVRAGPDSVLS